MCLVILGYPAECRSIVKVLHLADGGGTVSTAIPDLPARSSEALS